MNALNQIGDALAQEVKKGGDVAIQIGETKISLTQEETKWLANQAATYMTQEDATDLINHGHAL